jgi:hypothetical protein
MPLAIPLGFSSCRSSGGGEPEDSVEGEGEGEFMMVVPREHTLHGAVTALSISTLGSVSYKYSVHSNWLLYRYQLSLSSRAMSAPAKVSRTLRIIALPLTRATRTHGALTYYQFVTPPPPPEEAKNPGLIKWGTNKAASVWAGFGKAPEGNWKVALICLRRYSSSTRYV